MPKLSADALKARITELQKQLAAVKADKAPAIKKVRELMKKLGVTLADLGGASGGAPTKGRRGRPSGKNSQQGNGNGAKPGKTRRAVAIKYRDDKGNTWTGRGKTPRWLVEAEKAGAARDSFLIK